jgi:hypothetical protein
MADSPGGGDDCAPNPLAGGRSGSAYCGDGDENSGSCITVAGSGSEYAGGLGSGSENCGSDGGAENESCWAPLKGDGIGGVVGKSPAPLCGCSSAAANGDGGVDGSPNEGGGVLGSPKDGMSDGVASASGGKSMTWPSSAGGCAIRVLSSEAGVEPGTGSDGICNGSSSAAGSAAGGGAELAGVDGFGGSAVDLSAEAMSSLLATIVL